MECLGLHNKPKAEVRPGHLLTGPKEKEEEEEEAPSKYCIGGWRRDTCHQTLAILSLPAVAKHQSGIILND
jgi:hypothetical protein